MSQLGAKVSGAVATGTTASGGATWLEWIPGEIGKLATLIGAVLSLVLIVYWIQRIITDHKRDKLELEKLRRELKS